MCCLKGGDHTRTKTKVVSKIGGLAAFTKKKETCLGCKTPLNTSNTDAFYPTSVPIILPYRSSSALLPPGLFLPLPQRPHPLFFGLFMYIKYIFYFQLMRCVSTASRTSQGFIRRRFLIFEFWRKDFLGCGLSVKDARVHSMKMFSAQGV